MAQPRFRGLHHIALVTRDMAATIRFWRDLVGLPLRARMGRRGYRQYFFEIVPGTSLAFFEWPQVQPLPGRDPGVPVAGPLGFDHVCILMDGRDALWALKDRFEAADWFVTEVIDHEYVLSMYVHDPNGISVEFSVPGTVDLYAGDTLCDSDPPAEALEGSDPQAGVWKEVEEPTREEERVVYPGDGV